MPISPDLRTYPRTLVLEQAEDCLRLGQWLASELVRSDLRCVLLHGPLGCGKTWLCRALALGLPGGKEIEPASPSFTICNEYPTTPPVIHCDLYRCQQEIPEELLEALDNGERLCLVEWAEYLSFLDLPANLLDIKFKIDKDRRLLNFAAKGNSAWAILERLFHDEAFTRIAEQNL